MDIGKCVWFGRTEEGRRVEKKMLLFISSLNIVNKLKIGVHIADPY